MPVGSILRKLADEGTDHVLTALLIDVVEIKEEVQHRGPLSCVVIVQNILNNSRAQNRLSYEHSEVSVTYYGHQNNQ